MSAKIGLLFYGGRLNYLLRMIIVHLKPENVQIVQQYNSDTMFKINHHRGY